MLLHVDESNPAAYPAAPADLSPQAAALDPALIWQRIEAFIRYRWAERSVVWIVTGSAYTSGRGTPWQPPLTPATVTTMEVWDRGAEEWQAAAQVPKAPVGYLLARNCTYRVTATVGSTDTPPAAVLEAYRRLAEYMAAELSAPVGAKSYSVSIGQISERISLDRDHVAASIHKSGAADLLRPYRRLGVNDEAA